MPWELPLEVAEGEERHTQAFEVVRVPQWVWEGTSADLGVVSLPPTITTAPSLTCLALLPAWGGVAWAEGSLKHKTVAGKTVVGTFSRPPAWWRRGQAAAVKLDVPRSLPHVDCASSRPHPLMRLGRARAQPLSGLFSPSLSPASSPSRLWGQGLPCKSGEFLPTRWPEHVASVHLPSQTGNCLPLS